jgi:hypothetical protein
MNPRELVDHIRSGPTEFVFDKPLRFRRRTRSNPCDFNEFLQALQSSETIRTVKCESQLELEITEDEWVLLVKTIGSIRDIQNLKFWFSAGSLEFRPFQAVADALKKARSLRELEVHLKRQQFPRDSAGLAALAYALREHTTLQEFNWFDFVSPVEAAPVDLSPDLVFRALLACPHLREVTIVTKCASAGAMKDLLQLPEDTVLALVLNTKHFSALADGIRQGRCNIKRLCLVALPHGSRSKNTEAAKAIASAIRLDRKLEYLQIRHFFTNEAGAAMAEALTVNKTLLMVVLKNPLCVQDADALSATTYEAFSAMLRVNTSLRLELPAFNDAVGDERLADSRNQMLIEQSLNAVGRGRLLSSSQTPRKEWVDALNELNSSNGDESPELDVSCLYSLLRLNPATCM